MIRRFVYHPTAANLLMVLLLVLGAVSIGNIVRSTFPEQPLKHIQVTVPYPGAAADEVDQAICYRLEDAIDQVDQIKEYQCESRDNLATLKVEGREGVVIDREVSFMVGDAAYKESEIRPDGRPGFNFSNSDRRFAANAGLMFYEPQDFFGWKDLGGEHMPDIEALNAFWEQL